MNAVLAATANVVAASGVVTAALVFLRSRDVLLALKVLLDLLLAAGLLRLAAQPSWAQIAAAAVIVAIRKFALFGFVRAHSSVADEA